MALHFVCHDYAYFHLQFIKCVNHVHLSFSVLTSKSYKLRTFFIENRLSYIFDGNVILIPMLWIKSHEIYTFHQIRTPNVFSTTVQDVRILNGKFYWENKNLHIKIYIRCIWTWLKSKIWIQKRQNGQQKRNKINKQTK